MRESEKTSTRFGLWGSRKLWMGPAVLGACVLLILTGVAWWAQRAVLRELRTELEHDILSLQGSIRYHLETNQEYIEMLSEQMASRGLS